MQFDEGLELVGVRVTPLRFGRVELNYGLWVRSAAVRVKHTTCGLAARGMQGLVRYM